jgi:hypothetical protein
MAFLRVRFWVHCCFLFTHINGLPKIVNYKIIPILFSDDTSILVKGSNLKVFKMIRLMPLIVYINCLE